MKIWFIFLWSVALAKHEIYDGWKSYLVAPNSTQQLEILGQLEMSIDAIFYVRPRLDREGLVIVKPQYQKDFLNILRNADIDYRVHSEDVKTQLEYEERLIEARHVEFRTNKTQEKPWDNYVPLDVIDDYLDYIASNYSNIVTLVTPGRSFEGRPIKYLKISSSNFEDRTKSIIFIESAIHAHEWIAPPVATYAIHKLVEDLTDPELLENFDWIILPISNPDGYEYTHTTERFWRKTRSTDQSPQSKECPGVDGNRNYDFFWGTVGTSTNPCAINYGGSKAFSEIETRIVRDILHEYLDRMDMYLTLHSFGSMILYPWGHDGSLSHNALGLHTVGVVMADAIYEKKLPHFPRYVVGNSRLVLWYGASGGAEDYAHSIGVPLAFTYELPGLMQGFDLDPKYVRQVSEETWAGIVAGAKKARELVNNK